MRKSLLSAVILALLTTTTLTGCQKSLEVTDASGRKLPNWPSRFDPDPLPKIKKGDNAKVALARERAAHILTRKKYRAGKGWYLKLREKSK